jgi:NAD(P)-dependent dehydrogenase (short-subunit alcohol dehydrogenase family)
MRPKAGGRWLSCRHPVFVGQGEALAAELGGLGVTGSNQSNDDLKRLVDETMKKWGRVDALVNSAGHGPRAPLLDITDEQWHAALDVYFLNVARAVRLVAPILVAQKGGSIVNISTAWVSEPSPMFPTSAVARAGLAAYTKLFADQYAADNVRMNNVLPGWIDSLPATEERRAGVPMQRYGTSEEIAATVAFLVSDGAGYITGQNIRVDGGLMRSVWQCSRRPCEADDCLSSRKPGQRLRAAAIVARTPSSEVTVLVYSRSRSVPPMPIVGLRKRIALARPSAMQNALRRPWCDPAPRRCWWRPARRSP